ncbi:putative allantoinase 1 [Metarhizium anisopliae]|uniref:Oxo-4-hydroxy-4-carboxy-5-ureidoimidazoline decarboxylase n=2 Tax=Metarhizium robertsii TaxID=568076 RepID=E9EQS0_METRA|nr:Oxo-4-hydroxy-4-carboxy-5-ureidoimidazoline decarboxylase [Metarhizium robertsii ARSEF 23]EFZ02840.1 Oxo-4-hydroxy-4-carboxy-5-ureidoimidazoline decarboxylase [Metarhizium robertsii ARSEF 23]EXV06087.1 OHCU decarboxylase [Metarhizium robertsii]KAF5130370.1 putative allantoinase 1 [Metarhizium anisopliae]
MAHKLPQIGVLQSLSEDAQTKTLDLLFEPSPAIHSTLLPVVRNAKYSSYSELIDECRPALFDLSSKSTPSNPNPVLLSVVGSHPRLGSKKVDSAQSASEQANLQGQGEQLTELNREYEEKFPGLRFVVFVNGRGRPEIMKDMRARIDRGDFAMEVDAALEAMCDIAKDRASKLLA